MKKDNLIHIKLEYDESLRLQRDILSTQRGMLRVMKRINNYGIYRSKELEIKAKLYRRSKDLKRVLGVLQKTLPKLEIPHILKKDSSEHVEKEEIEDNMKIQRTDIEEQLYEIQQRLNHLQSEESLIK